MKPIGVDRSVPMKLIRMLTQYDNAPAAVIREYVSNAIDAISGVDGGHVDVVLPTDDDPTFIVRDNGCGMSADFMTGMLSNYLASTKEGDHGSIGSKGIGSKAAFSVSDSFDISSICDGRRTVCAYRITDDRCGYDMSTEEADGMPNGTEVRVRIKDEGVIGDMVSEAPNVLRGFDKSMLTVTRGDGTPVDIDWFSHIENSIPVRPGMSLAIGEKTSKRFSVIQGGVWYDITDSALARRLRSLMFPHGVGHGILSALASNARYYGDRAFHGIVVIVPANALTTNPSREHFESTVANARVLRSVLDIEGYCESIGVGRGADNVKAWLLEALDRRLSNPGYLDLPYNRAVDIISVIQRVFDIGTDRNGMNQTVPIGGMPMSPKEFGGDGRVYRRRVGRGGYVENGSIEPMINIEKKIVFVGHAVDATGGIDETGIHRVMARHGLAAERLGVADPDRISYFVFSAKDSHDGIIPFWMARAMKVTDTTMSDLLALMRTSRGRRKGRDGDEVSCMRFSSHGRGSHFGAPNRMNPKSITGMSKSGALTSRAFSVNGDVYSTILRLRSGRDAVEAVRTATGIDFETLSIDEYIRNRSDPKTIGHMDIIIVNRSRSPFSEDEIMAMIPDISTAYDDLDLDRGIIRARIQRIYDETAKRTVKREIGKMLRRITGAFEVGDDCLFDLIRKRDCSGLDPQTLRAMDTMRRAESLSKESKFNGLGRSIDMDSMMMVRLRTLGATPGDDEMLAMGLFEKANEARMLLESRYPLLRVLSSSQLWNDSIIDDTMDYIRAMDAARISDGHGDSIASADADASNENGERSE